MIKLNNILKEIKLINDKRLPFIVTKENFKKEIEKKLEVGNTTYTYLSRLMEDMKYDEISNKEEFEDFLLKASYLGRSTIITRLLIDSTTND